MLSVRQNSLALSRFSFNIFDAISKPSMLLYGAGGETRTHGEVSLTDYKSVPIAAMGHQHLSFLLL